MNRIKSELIKIYSKNSKHSNYQILPSALNKIINSDDIRTITRYEKERFDYIFKKIFIKGKYILDVGGNTGFFTFELLNHGAKKVHFCEGNKKHAEFVELAAGFLKLNKRIRVTSKYLFSNNSFLDKYDVIFLLNVLHHAGDDYGDNIKSIKAARENILKEINSLKNSTDIMVLQLGFNWKGDRDKCLFNEGTKKEMIDFLKEGISDNWDILNIGIAEKKNNKVEYVDLNYNNIVRNDKIGEFLNRPLFILKSRK